MCPPFRGSPAAAVSAVGCREGTKVLDPVHVHLGWQCDACRLQSQQDMLGAIYTVPKY